jgi:Flp pilus assembly pilin Flp
MQGEEMAVDRIGRIIATLPSDERGAAAVEYAMVAGLVSLAVFAGAAVMGDGVAAFFTSLTNSFLALQPPAP